MKINQKIENYIREKYGDKRFYQLGSYNGQECYLVSLAKDDGWIADDYYLLFDSLGNLVREIYAGGQFIDEETEETKLAAKIEEYFSK
jgi:hypothetical protein